MINWSFVNKKYGIICTVIRFTDTALETQTAVTGGVSVATFLRGVGLSVCITLSKTSVPFFQL